MPLDWQGKNLRVLQFCFFACNIVAEYFKLKTINIRLNLANVPLSIAHS